MESVQCDVLVIGAGVIGLSVASRLAPALTTVLAESHSRFGQETSSRNSEVIHSGIYYPPGSRKTEWCLEGRGLLYAYCRRHGVPHVKTGKIVVATEASEEGYLDKLAAHCASLSVPHRRLTGAEVSALEPLVQARSGLLLTETGIVDSHQLMAALEREFLEAGGLAAYRHRIAGLERRPDGWRACVERPEGPLEIGARWVVNAAGLAAAELSNLALATSRYEHRFCRGRYFTLPSSYRGKFTRLVYPCPPKDGLGIHVTVDTEGFARLGPDVDWCPGVSYAGVSTLYDCDWEALREPFLDAARRYCPSLSGVAAQPSQIGIRAKLFVDGQARPDFLVERHGNWIHCLGIESPGLTSSLAIASEVVRLVEGI